MSNYRNYSYDEYEQNRYNKEERRDSSNISIRASIEQEADADANGGDGGNGILLGVGGDGGNGGSASISQSATNEIEKEVEAPYDGPTRKTV